MSVPSIDSFGGQPDAALDSAQEPSLAELMRALARTAEPQLPSLEDGEMIGEHLRIEGRLGKGGMGVVYLAHDLRLDRPVAVKLLARGHEDGIARLEREARAMAKLSHPNVAVVHEVGRHRGLPYIAMEYVDGGTARSWLRMRPRTWQEIVALYLQAARGLAAAHAAGFVHRDFKPDNVLVGGDGRARVADFGLVRLQGGEARELRSTWASSDELASGAHDTATDAVMGTPAYMAPEQKLGADVGPASDQFALCLALDEALAGGHVDARRRGPRARRIPRWLRQAIARGMATEPEARWPSMDVLADRLERGLRGGARRMVIVGVAVTAILAAAIGVALGARSAAEGCDEGAALVAEHWSSARREDIERAFAERGGGAAWASAATAIDRWADGWARAHDGSCRATRVAGTQTERLLERSTACLADRTAELDALLDALAQPEAATVEVVGDAIGELSGATPCGDAGYLLARPEPSGTDELREHVRRTAALRMSGRVHDADAAASALHELGGLADGARAAALHELAALARAHGDHEGARRLARDAYLAARHAEHDELSARAALQLGEVELALVRGDTSAANTWIGFARVELERGVADPRLWIPLLRAHARALERTGDHAGARTQRGRALELAATDESRALLSAELAVELAAGSLAAGEAEPAALAYPDAIAALERELGADHPALAVARTDFARALAATDDHARALEQHRRAAAIERAAVGRTPHADATLALADALVRAGDPEAARALLDEAIDRLSPAGDTLALARANATLGELDLDRSDAAAALPRLERALAIRRALLGDDDIAVARTQVTIGDALLELDRTAAAKDAFRVAIEGWQRAGAEADETLAHAKAGLARAEASDATGAAAIVPPRPRPARR